MSQTPLRKWKWFSKAVASHTKTSPHCDTPCENHQEVQSAPSLVFSRFRRGLLIPRLKRRMKLHLTMRPCLLRLEPCLLLLLFLRLPHPITTPIIIPRHRPSASIPVPLAVASTPLFLFLLHIIDQPKRRCDIILIQIMHIIHIPKPMTRIRNQITPIRILCIFPQTLALVHVILDIRLNIRQLGYLELAHRNGRRMIILQKSHFARIQKEKRSSHPIRIARNPRHSENVLGGIIRRFELNDPIDAGGYVQIPSRRVGRAEYTLVHVGKSEEGLDELFFFHPAVHGEAGYVEMTE
mmetsp:Transcript_4557/g.9289  ORF Transcript_4557/g.9289 Transcript_4557/m.9289 type:complete len:295 (-) Transcript_4557:720-1604(-)